LEDKLSTSHLSPIIDSLYSSAYNCIITCDKGGSVNVWNLLSDKSENSSVLINSFSTNHTNFTVSASLGFIVDFICISFADETERKLITTGSNGCIYIWNFITGKKIFG
jgi:WD40 repeat protein